MKHGILTKSGWGHGAGFQGTDLASRKQPLDPGEREALWQKHVVIGLWLLLALLILAATALVLAEGQGYFSQPASRQAAPASWPAASYN